MAMQRLRTVCVHVLVHPLYAVLLATILTTMPMRSDAFDLAVSPTSIEWNANTWVSCTVSNTSPGGTVDLALFADIDRDAALGENDRLLIGYRLTDGVTNRLGSRAIPDDSDATADGVIRAEISYVGLHDAARLWHTPGRYLWYASDGAGGMATAPFVVTQQVSGTWITGQVMDFPSATPVSGAAVILEPFLDHLGPLPAGYTDTNGVFAIYVPNGYPSQNVAGVEAVLPGGLMSEEGPDGDWFSWQPITNELATGANALPSPLLVVDGHGIGDDVFMISGYVYDAETNPVPGVLVICEPDADDDPPWGLATSDTNGFFELPAITGDQIVYTVPLWMNRLGLTAAGAMVTVTANVTNVELICPAATVLAKVPVTEAVSGKPVVGASVEIESEDSLSVDFTLDDGIAWLAVNPGTTEIGPDDETLEALGYLSIPRLEDVAITAPGPFTNVSFEAVAGYALTGHVYDPLTNGLGFGDVQINWTRSFDWYGEGWVNRQGYYEVLVPTGVYRAVAMSYEDLGYLSQVYSNHYTWEWDNGPIGEPISVDTNGVAGIDFFLEAGAVIRGTVRDEYGQPLDAGVRADAAETDGQNQWWNWRGQTDTDSDGSYSLLVPEGTNYRVHAWADGYLTEYYDGYYSYQIDPATPVDTFIATPATNIDFALDEPSYIMGCVHSGGTPVSNINVMADWVANPDEWWERNFVGGAISDVDGHYALSCPPGSNFIVQTRPDVSTFYPEMFWSNALNGDDWTAVTVLPDSNATNIDFDLPLGGRIEGTVLDVNGTDPYPSAWVSAVDTNDTWFDGSPEDDGSYAVVVPAGVYKVRVGSHDYLEQYFDGHFSYQWDEADPVTVSVAHVTCDIDFTMEEPSYIEGQVLGDGSTIEGVCVMAHWQADTNRWWNTDHVNETHTDGNGDYSIAVPPGSNYIVSTDAGPTSYFPPYFWSNTVDQSMAARVVVGPAGTVSGIDFDMELGMRITGSVTDQDGLPLEGIYVESLYTDTNGNSWFAGGCGTGEDGSYAYAVSDRTNYIVQANPDSGSIYPRRFYPDAYLEADATLVWTNAGSTVDGVDIRMFPGFRINARVMEAPAPTLRNDAFLSVCESREYWLDAGPAGDGGWAGLVAPTSFPVFVYGSAEDCEAEYYADSFDLTYAAPLQLPAYSTTNITLVLYGASADSDGDGLRDYEEDTRPDGLYHPDQDFSSFTNSNTDGDSHSDYEEVYVLHTDPGDSESRLGCVDVRVQGNDLVVSWGSDPSVEYWVICADNAMSTNWSVLGGPYSGTVGTNRTTVTLGDEMDNTNRVYRMQVQY